MEGFTVNNLDEESHGVGVCLSGRALSPGFCPQHCKTKLKVYHLLLPPLLTKTLAYMTLWGTVLLKHVFLHVIILNEILEFEPY
jgi:hypothetical protein